MPLVVHWLLLNCILLSKSRIMMFKTQACLCTALLLWIENPVLKTASFNLMKRTYFFPITTFTYGIYFILFFFTLLKVVVNVLNLRFLAFTLV